MAAVAAISTLKIPVLVTAEDRCTILERLQPLPSALYATLEQRQPECLRELALSLLRLCGPEAAQHRELIDDIARSAEAGMRHWVSTVLGPNSDALQPHLPQLLEYARLLCATAIHGSNSGLWYTGIGVAPTELAAALNGCKLRDGTLSAAEADQLGQSLALLLRTVHITAKRCPAAEARHQQLQGTLLNAMILLDRFPCMSASEFAADLLRVAVDCVDHWETASEPTTKATLVCANSNMGSLFMQIRGCKCCLPPSSTCETEGAWAKALQQACQQADSGDAPAALLAFCNRWQSRLAAAAAVAPALLIVIGSTRSSGRSPPPTDRFDQVMVPVATAITFLWMLLHVEAAQGLRFALPHPPPPLELPQLLTSLPLSPSRDLAANVRLGGQWAAMAVLLPAAKRSSAALNRRKALPKEHAANELTSALCGIIAWLKWQLPALSDHEFTPSDALSAATATPELALECTRVVQQLPSIAEAVLEAAAAGRLPPPGSCLPGVCVMALAAGAELVTLCLKGEADLHPDGDGDLAATPWVAATLQLLPQLLAAAAKAPTQSAANSDPKPPWLPHIMGCPDNARRQARAAAAALGNRLASLPAWEPPPDNLVPTARTICLQLAAAVQCGNPHVAAALRPGGAVPWATTRSQLLKGMSPSVHRQLQPAFSRVENALRKASPAPQAIAAVAADANSLQEQAARADALMKQLAAEEERQLQEPTAKQSPGKAAKRARQRAAKAAQTSASLSEPLPTAQTAAMAATDTSSEASAEPAAVPAAAAAAAAAAATSTAAAGPDTAASDSVDRLAQAVCGQLAANSSMPANHRVNGFAPTVAAPASGTSAAQQAAAVQQTRDSRHAHPAAMAWQLCPITGEAMQDPVLCADGVTYERAAIQRHLATHSTSPTTGQVLPDHELLPNHAVRNLIAAMARGRSS